MDEIVIEGDVPIPQGRPAGSPNYLPCEAVQKLWLRKLRQDADMGDVNAMTALLLLARLHKDERGRKDTVTKLLDAIA